MAFSVTFNDLTKEEFLYIESNMRKKNFLEACAVIFWYLKRTRGKEEPRPLKDINTVGDLEKLWK